MKLSDRYKELTDEQREALAQSVGISSGYLWQLAVGWVRPNRGKAVRPSIDLMSRLAAADAALDVAAMVAEFSAPVQEAAA